jgi:acyl carrier protein
MDPILSAIQQALIAVKPELSAAAVTDAATMSDLGLDSVGLVEVGVHLESSLGGDISFDAWLDQERLLNANAFSIGSLVAYIHSCGSSATQVHQ